jgi:hypothetical protein
MLGRSVLIGATNYMFFEPTEKCREARAATESDDAETAVRSFRFERGLFHHRMANNDDPSLYRKEFSRRERRG